MHHYTLPLRLTATPRLVSTCAAKLFTQDPYKGTVIETFNKDSNAVKDYEIMVKDIVQVYVSPYPYNAAFKEYVDLR